MPKQYSLIVIGGGSGGYAAARTVREARDGVAIVDGAQELGGLCILRGCMPSKTLIHTAEVLQRARHGLDLGLQIPEVRADMATVQARKQRIIGEFARDRQEALGDGRFDLYRQKARFVDAHTIELQDGQRLTGERFIIATGSRVNVPPVPGLAEWPFWTSDNVLALDFVPDSAVILGGGIIACEMGQFLHRIGTKVTIVQRNTQLLSGMSPRLAETIHQALTAEGIEIFLGCSATRVENREKGEGVRVIFDCKQKGCTERIEASYLVNALGRVPNIDGLGLDAADVEADRLGFIATDEYQRTSQPHIYAVGDCANRHMIVHQAVLQGEIAGKHILGENPPTLNHDHTLDVIFTDPEAGQVGLTEHELDARGIPCCTASHPFDDHGKSITMNETRGYVKVIARKPDGLILGAEVVGPHGSDLIHTMSAAVALEHTVMDMLRVQWYHPTLSEIWTYPLEEIAETCGVDYKPEGVG